MCLVVRAPVICLKYECGLEAERIRNASVTHRLFTADPFLWLSAGKEMITMQCSGPGHWAACRVGPPAGCSLHICGHVIDPTTPRSE